jgi:hypothetical protein
VVGLLLAAASLVFLCFRLLEDWRRLDVESWTLAPAPLGVHFALSAVSFLLLVAGWHLLLRAFGAAPSFAASAHSWFLGGLARYIPGKVASLLGRLAVCSRHGIPTARSATALVVEQVLYAAIGLAYLVVAIPAVRRNGTATLALVGLLLAVSAVALLLVDPGLVAKLAARRTGADTAAASLGPRRRQLLLAGAVLLAGWSLYGVAGFFLATAVHPMPLASLPRVALAFLGSWAAGFLAFLVPAGLGVREATLSLLLGPLVPGPLDVVVALASRLSWVVVELAGTALAVVAVVRRERLGGETA